MIRAIVACEESQAVLVELLKLGVDAYSCDLLPTSGPHPERHFQEDIFGVLMREEPFDLMIAHPPCTYLTVTGNRWFNEEVYGDKARKRKVDREEAVEFVRALHDSYVPHVAIENPIGYLSTAWRKPDQIIHPWQHGDRASKTTCLWTKGLPLIEPTEVVDKGEFFEWTDANGRQKRQPMWYYRALLTARTPAERSTLRSKTFPGIARALATKYTEYVTNKKKGA